jgi:serine protease Do
LGALCTRGGMNGPTSGILRQSRACPAQPMPQALRVAPTPSGSREDLIARSAQAVVTIEGGVPFQTGMLTVNLNERNPLLVTQKGSVGSGFIVDSSGLILTSARTVGADCQLNVRLADGRRLRANVVRVNYGADVALLRLVSNPGRLTALPLNLSGNPAVGTSVMAISGNPSQLMPVYIGNDNPRRVTSGIISGTLTSGALQSNLPTKSGDTGAPVFNERGQVVGLVLTEYNPIGTLEVPKGTSDQAAAAYAFFSRNIYITEVMPITSALTALGLR